MAVNPMLNSGAVGIQQGVRAIESVAAEVAEFNQGSEPPKSTVSNPVAPAPNTEDVAEAMVDLKLYQRQVQASAKVVETADEVIGFLLDVHA